MGEAWGGKGEGKGVSARFSAAGLEGKPTIYQSLATAVDKKMSYKKIKKKMVRKSVKYNKIKNLIVVKFHM